MQKLTNESRVIAAKKNAFRAKGRHTKKREVNSRYFGSTLFLVILSYSYSPDEEFNAGAINWS